MPESAGGAAAPEARGLRVTVEESPAPADSEVVTEGLLQFNIGYIGHPDPVPLAAFVRDASDRVIGGLTGTIRWRWLYVEKLWLPDELRGRGLGRKLMTDTEDFARSRGCAGIHLDTFEYQALDFYKSLGYEQFGVNEGYPPGYRQYHLRKQLK